MNIVFLDTATVADLPQELALFSELGNFTSYESTSPDEVVDRLQGAEVAIVNKVKLGANEMSKLPELKLICVAATGTNNIDHEAAEKHDLIVRNVAGYSTQSVAQFTFATLFTLSMDICHLNQSVHDGTYSKQSDFAIWRQPYYELSGSRFGIIGLGSIGREVARLARAFGAEVVYYSTSGKHDDPDFTRVSLDELLETSDVISIHCPLNEHTHHLISADQLEKMKSSAYLVNVARGGIVHEAQLAAALDEAQIAGAVCDVFTQEPISAEHPYLQLKHPERLLLTPHVAWASVEARKKLLEGIRNNIQQGW